MDFQNIPVSVQPVYTWLWNTEITYQGIKEQIDEMYESGIRAFYVIGEPENFIPNRRRTHLSPEYLSDEYLDLLFFAFETAKEKGMYMWLYNEGGFPSGMVCGKICKKFPELSIKLIESVKLQLEENTPFSPHERGISAFVAGRRIQKGEFFADKTEVTEYRFCNADSPNNRSDNASRRNTDIFLEMTHEKYKKRFGKYIGTDITLMFDDEAHMGTWTEGLEKIFLQKYGYDIADYMPYITNSLQPETYEQYRAKSDYIMLCGDLIRDNYFSPMKKWLNSNNMLSVGHLDNDNKVEGTVANRYGNTLKTLREFDLPGIDVIWSQIDYPINGKCCPDGFEFFPRMASSAARQLGHSKCISESFAVYGAHVTPELMRYVVNYQAVRGISLFNFMVISYDRKTPMSLQYRPNFIKENPSMNRLSQINNYTARLSFILQESKADISTALYFPARSICADGIKGAQTRKSFEELGNMLEEKGVSFDIIDEDLVLGAEVKNGLLICENTYYKNVFIPSCDFEIDGVIQKLECIKHEIKPCLGRKNRFIQARKVIFANGDEGYFICNTDSKTISETVSILTDKNICRVELSDGMLYSVEHSKKTGIIELPLTLLRGEGIFLLLSNSVKDTFPTMKTETVCTLTDFSSFISRKYCLDAQNGIINTYFDSNNISYGLNKWDKNFSGEVTYTCRLPKLESGKYMLNLGEIRNTAVVYIDDKKIGEATMPPYKIAFKTDKGGETLTISVSNTIANECARTDYFDRHDIRDVGPYHAKMVIKEAKQSGGGLLGPVTVEKIC